MADNDQSQAPAEGQESSESGFAEAFAERSKDPSGEKQTGAEAAEAPASAATGGEESAAADSAQAPGKPAADEGSGPKPQGFDPYAGLTPEQKAHFDKLAASERSQRGRVGALTKKLNHLSSGTQSPPAGQGEGSQARSDAGAGGSGDGTQATDIEAKLKAATEEYGDIVGPLAEVVDNLRKEMAGLKASETRHEVERDAELLAVAYGRLEQTHPDYADVAQNPDFHGWLGDQPKGIQALANSFDPQEVSLALQLFKTERGAASQASGGAGQGGNGGTATGDRRERQLDGLREPPSRGAPAATGVPNDFKSAFRERSKANS